MDDSTDIPEDSGTVIRDVAPGANIMVQLLDGDYLLIPNALGFIEENKGQAMSIGNDSHIWILKKSLKPGMVKWVCVTEDDN